MEQYLFICIALVLVLVLVLYYKGMLMIKGMEETFSNNLGTGGESVARQIQTVPGNPTNAMAQTLLLAQEQSGANENFMSSKKALTGIPEHMKSPLFQGPAGVQAGIPNQAHGTMVLSGRDWDPSNPRPGDLTSAGRI